MSAHTNGHCSDLQPVAVADYLLPSPFQKERRRIPGRLTNLERLKTEIAVAVWNWEVRRGFSHYDGSFGGLNGQIAQDVKLYRARKKESSGNGFKP